MGIGFHDLLDGRRTCCAEPTAATRAKKEGLQNEEVPLWKGTIRSKVLVSGNG